MAVISSRATNVLHFIFYHLFILRMPPVERTQTASLTFQRALSLSELKHDFHPLSSQQHSHITLFDELLCYISLDQLPHGSISMHIHWILSILNAGISPYQYNINLKTSVIMKL